MLLCKCDTKCEHKLHFRLHPQGSRTALRAAGERTWLIGCGVLQHHRSQSQHLNSALQHFSLQDWLV